MIWHEFWNSCCLVSHVLLSCLNLTLKIEVMEFIIPQLFKSLAKYWINQNHKDSRLKKSIWKYMKKSESLSSIKCILQEEMMESDIICDLFCIKNDVTL